MLKRWIKTLLKVLLGLFVLLVVFLLFERMRGQVSLARYQRKLTAQGEKLTAREWATPVAAGENGAPMILDAITRLSNGVVLPKNFPPRMKLMPSGRAVVCFREPEWVEDKQTNRWDQLATDLQANETVLGEIRAGLVKPVLNNGVDVSLGAKMLFPHLAPAKSVTYWLGSGSQLALHAGDTHAAMPDLLALIRLPRLLAEDHILISELVRIAIAAIAKADTWETLQAGGWTDDDLATLQTTWEEQAFAATMARSLEGERIYMAAVSETIRESNEEAVGVMFGLEEYLPMEGFNRPAWESFTRSLPYGQEMADFLKKQVYCRVWRFAWSHQDQLRTLRNTQRLIELTRRAAVEKSFASVREAFTQFETESRNRSVYEKMRFPEPLADTGFSLSRSVSKALRSETDRSLAICAIALKRYAIRRGKFPATLDVLVPEFLTAVPVDYMDGRPLKYQLNADGSHTLYSVGEDGRDDGGDMSTTGVETTRNLWTRRDYVWPSPALPEEVEAYRKEAAKN
jgi:hypothetical protein